MRKLDATVRTVIHGQLKDVIKKEVKKESNLRATALSVHTELWPEKDWQESLKMLLECLKTPGTQGRVEEIVGWLERRTLEHRLLVSEKLLDRSIWC